MDCRLSVPKDLSVVGFDDTLTARWASIPLTTVHQPLLEMGKVAVERVITIADDPDAFSHPFQLETHLIVRETTGPVRHTSAGKTAGGVRRSKR
jgi:LacI family transcriptional regulator